LLTDMTKLSGYEVEIEKLTKITND